MTHYILQEIDSGLEGVRRFFAIVAHTHRLTTQQVRPPDVNLVMRTSFSEADSWEVRYRDGTKAILPDLAALQKELTIHDLQFIVS